MFQTFQVHLKTDYDIDVSEKRLYRVLNEDDIYLMHKKRQRNIARRFFDINYYCEVLQVDLAHMFEYNNFKYFVLVVDIFSSKLFGAPLKTKNSDEVAKVLRTLLNNYKTPITKIESDRGSEFGGKVKELLKKSNIVYRFKFGKNKASVIEHYIAICKKRIFMRLRGTLSKDWITALKEILIQFNNTPLKRLGWIKPSDINSVADSVKVQEAQKLYKIPILHEPSFEEQQRNVKSYNQKPNNIKEGMFCYLDFDEKLFDKSYNVSVSIEYYQL